MEGTAEILKDRRRTLTIPRPHSKATAAAPGHFSHRKGAVFKSLLRCRPGEKRSAAVSSFVGGGNVRCGTQIHVGRSKTQYTKALFCPSRRWNPKIFESEKDSKKALGGGMKSPPCTLLEGGGISKVTSGDGLKRKKKGFLPLFFLGEEKFFHFFFFAANTNCENPECICSCTSFRFCYIESQKYWNHEIGMLKHSLRQSVFCTR